MYFKTVNGKVFLEDNAPELLHKFVREAHEGSLPNDEVYRDCKAAFEAQDDVESVQPDMYTNQLLSWLSNGPFLHVMLVDNALEELQTTSVLDAIGYAQFTRRSELVHMLKSMSEEVEQREAN